jgi:hypothetical protein
VDDIKLKVESAFLIRDGTPTNHQIALILCRVGRDPELAGRQALGFSTVLQSVLCCEQWTNL